MLEWDIEKESEMPQCYQWQNTLKITNPGYNYINQDKVFETCLCQIKLLLVNLITETIVSSNTEQGFLC